MILPKEFQRTLHMFLNLLQRRQGTANLVMTISKTKEIFNQSVFDKEKKTLHVLSISISCQYTKQLPHYASLHFHTNLFILCATITICTPCGPMLSPHSKKPTTAHHDKTCYYSYQRFWDMNEANGFHFHCNDPIASSVCSLTWRMLCPQAKL